MRFQSNGDFLKLVVLGAIMCLSLLVVPFLVATRVNGLSDTYDISVGVTLTVSGDNTNGTYGPIPIQIKKSSDGIVLKTKSTDSKEAAPTSTITLQVTFHDMEADTYDICVKGHPDLCTTYILDPAIPYAIIDIPANKSADFFVAAPDLDAKSCEDTASLGFIVCPLVKGLAKLNDFMWNFVKSLLKISPLRQSDSSSSVGGSIYTAWSSIRGIANVLFVIFFLIIIFSQLTGAGVSNYGIKKLLPRIIVAAILVNVSFLIVQISVDLANIFGSGLYDLITGLAPPFEPKWEVLALGGLEIGAIGIAAGMVGGGVLFWTLLPIALMGALGFLAAMLTLIFRQAAIPILAILAPLAFVAYLLPNTQSWFKKWLKLLMTMMMLYPLAALVFAGAQFAAAVIMGSEGAGFMEVMIGQIMMVLPLFSLPFIAKQGGPMLTKVGGSLNKLAEKARKPLGGWAQSYKDRARARDLSDHQEPGRMRRFAERHGAGGIYNAPRTFRRGMKAGVDRRAKETEEAEALFKIQQANNQVRGVFGQRTDNRAAVDAATAAKMGEATIAQDSETRVIDANPVLNARHGGEELNSTVYRSAQQHARAVSANTERLMNDVTFDDLRTEVERTKTNADTATKHAERRTEVAPGILQVRARNTEASGSLEIQREHTKTAIEEASTDAATSSPAAMSIDAGTRAALQRNKLEQKVATSATASAINVSNQEVAETLAPPDGSIPAAAVQAGGIGGEAATVRVQAGATQEQATFLATNVAATKSLMRARGFGIGDDAGEDYNQVIRISVNGENPDGSTASLEQFIAADEMITETGSAKGMFLIWEAIAAMPDTTPDEHNLKLKRSQAFREAVSKSSKRPKSFDGTALSSLAAGTPTGSRQDLALRILKSTKIAPEDFISLDKHEIKTFTECAALLTPDQRTALKAAVSLAGSTEEISVRISEDKKAVMKELSDAL